MAVGLLCLIAQQGVAATKDEARQLAASCASCHAGDQRGGGIPSIARLDETAIVQSMLAYRSGQRTSQIMRVVAAALTPDEIVAVARYLAAQPTEATR